MLTVLLAVLGFTLICPGGLLARNVPDPPLLGFPPLPGHDREERLTVADWPGFFPVSPFLSGLPSLPVFNPFSQPQTDSHATDVLLDLIASLRTSLEQLKQRQDLIVEAIQCGCTQTGNCTLEDSVNTVRYPDKSGGILNQGFPGFSGGLFGGNGFPGFSGGVFGGTRFPILTGGLLGGGGLQGGLSARPQKPGFSGGLTGISGFPGSLGGSVLPGPKPVKPMMPMVPANMGVIPPSLTTIPNFPINNLGGTFSGSSTVTGPDGTVTTTVVGKPGEEPVVTTVTSKPPPKVMDEEVTDVADEV